MAFDKNRFTPLFLPGDADSQKSGSGERMSPRPASSSDKASNYIKSRFDKDNWFGSLAIGANTYRGYTSLMSALVREENGVKQPDKTRATTNVLSILVNLWSFFSQRGGDFPEGDTPLERLTDTAKHPNSSSTQFEFLARIPVNILAVYNNLEKGLKAYGIGLKRGEKAYGAEKVRLYSGIAIAVGTALSGFGHFRTHGTQAMIEQQGKEEANTARRSSGFMGVMRRIWKHDKMLVLGTLFDIVLPVLQAIESWKKKEESGKEAGYIMQNALIGILVNYPRC